MRSVVAGTEARNERRKETGTATCDILRDVEYACPNKNTYLELRKAIVLDLEPYFYDHHFVPDRDGILTLSGRLP
jgi:hypothetical protein